MFVSYYFEHFNFYQVRATKNHKSSFEDLVKLEIWAGQLVWALFQNAFNLVFHAKHANE